MRIAVLGCGRWGSFLAWYCQRIGHEVCLWGRAGSQKLAELKTTGQNKYLSLCPEITLTDDLEETLGFAQAVLIAINAQNFRGFMEKVAAFDVADKSFVLCMKGLESNTGLRLSEVFSQCVAGARCAVWVGPGHVQSFVKGVPNCMLVDSESYSLRMEIAEMFTSDLIRLFTGSDIIGTEIGAAAKNPVGIAAGMLDGMGQSALKGALMAKAPREIAGLIRAAGGDPMSAYGLAHLGNYSGTLFEQRGRNRMFGEQFAKSVPTEGICDGVPTLHALHILSQKLGVTMPICETLHSIVIGGLDPQTEINKLFLRGVNGEF